MAVFTKVSDQAVGEWLAAYGLPTPDAVTGIEEGTENTNYKVMANGQRFIVTLFEGRTAVEDLPYFLGLMDHVANKGLPCARPIRTSAGERLTVLAGKPAALISFLPGRPNMAPTYQDAEKAGATLAKFHIAAQDFPYTRPNSMGLGSWRDMLKAADDRLDTFGAGLAAELKKTLASLRRSWPSEIKRGTIHGDLFPDNLLLDHGEPSGIIDLYFACTDYLAYDLAIAMNAYLPEAGSLDITNADAMFEGYNRVRPLTKLELEAMPTLLCGCALRFFLSRAVDALDESQSAIYTPKDPLPWLRLMRHHRHQMERSG